MTIEKLLKYVADKKEKLGPTFALERIEMGSDHWCEFVLDIEHQTGVEFKMTHEVVRFKGIQVNHVVNGLRYGVVARWNDRPNG